MGNVVRLVPASAPIAPTVQRGCNVTDNRRSGFVLLYKSLREAAFYREPMRKAMWLHLLLEAAHENTVSVFNGNRLVLTRGQIVGSARSLGDACGVSEDSARRSLEVFEREGMITRTSKTGVKGFTLITVLNYSQYQRGVSEHVCAEFGAEFKAAPDMGSQGGAEFDCAELGATNHAEDLNNINNKTKDLKDSSSKIADAMLDQQSPLAVVDADEPNHDQQDQAQLHTSLQVITEEPANSEAPEQVTRLNPDAAVQTPNGKFWGTQDDLTCAKYIHGKVLVVNPTAKSPNWSRWANEIRLMRSQDLRTHHEICSLFKWANLDPFWSANVLCPQTLRKQWDKLQAKRVGIVRQPTHGDEWDLTKTMTAEKLNKLIQEGF
ncbi:MAG: hypothetical protein ACRDDA_07395 [Aeromonas sp.]